MKQFFFLLFVALGVISCAQETSIDSLTESEGPILLSVIKDPNYSPHQINDAIPGNYDAYLKYLTGTDYEIGISSHRDGALSGGRKVSCISGVSQIQPLKTRSATGDLPKITSFVDGIEISQENLSQIKTRGSSKGIADLFGKNVTFTFYSGPRTRSSDSDCGEADLYIPKEIEVLAPYAETEEDVNPLCYYKDFILRWNKDEENENGVLVLIEWYGNMVLGNDIEDTFVRRIVSFPDTGEVRLPEQLFEGIPDTAWCNLTILRGNIENIDYENASYKIIGETHQLISFILIREINNK